MKSSRRSFLQAAGAAAVISRSVLGANDRVRVGFIGLGARTGLLDAAWLKQEDCDVAAVCDVNSAKIDAYQTRKQTDANVTARGGLKVDSFTDYRRILDRKDIDAVLIAVPDHWHAPIMIAAVEAGKDVYVEKPCSNTVPAAVAMLKAYRSHKQVVQLGTQQRSWAHFREAAKLIWDGYIGTVNQVVVHHGGGGGAQVGRGGQASTGPQPIPEGLNWDMFLGSAKKVPYDPQRYSSWRSYYDYGGGMITDWGVHWMDIVQLCMQTDVSGPSYASSVSAYWTDKPNLELVPGNWNINYRYDKYLMSFLSFVPPTSEPISGGPTFYGSKGYLTVNRSGYIVRPNRGMGGRSGAPGGAAAGRAGQPAEGGRGGAAGAPQAIPGRAEQLVLGGAAPQGTRGGMAGRAQQPQEPPIEPITKANPSESVSGERGSEVVHVRNFLDCVKSRQKPTAEFEIGFHSTLPCLLGRQSVQEGRALAWDEKTLTARPA